MLSDRARFASIIAGLERAGISQPQIAAQTGLSRGTFGRLANEISRARSYATVHKIETLHHRTVAQPRAPSRR
jgi:transcriptional regulator with XRE-family HTH domain